MSKSDLLTELESLRADLEDNLSEQMELRSMQRSLEEEIEAVELEIDNLDEDEQREEEEEESDGV